MGGRTPDLNTASVALYQLSYCPRHYELGGGEEARTPGLDSAIVALYQLSYTPKLLVQYTTQKVHCQTEFGSAAGAHSPRHAVENGVSPT